MKKHIITIAIILLGYIALNAQNEGVCISSDNSTPDPSAMLEIKSATKGLLLTRVALTGINDVATIPNAANGLFVFSENGNVPDGLYYWNDANSQWVYVITANDITDFGSGQVITEAERTILNSAIQSEEDPVFTAHVANNITDAGSGAIITATERTTLGTALQSETDPVFIAHVANNITNAGSGKIITTTERDSLKTALQTETDPVFVAHAANGVTNAGSGVIITAAERTKLNGIEENANNYTHPANQHIPAGGSEGQILTYQASGTAQWADPAPGVPTGTIISFAGTVAPDGWIVCNGAAISRTTYADLYAVIGTAWGNGDGASTFNLPDLRGRFLRGFDNGAGNDPDAASRTALSGGNTGDAVGSYQEDAFKEHNHSISGRNRGTTTPPPNINIDNADNTEYTVNTGNTGGTETRPKNANVNYIIKY